MNHPSEADLALYAGGDLPFIRSWRLGRHIQKCAACSEELASFRTVVADLAEGVDATPDGLRWERLADEMVANINVGVQAGECVTPVYNGASRMDWRAA